MKSTGIVRKIDELGRIVLPIELRRTHHLSTRDSVEIYTEGDAIVITKYEPSCIFCGANEDVLPLERGHVLIGAKCREELNGKQ